MNARLLLAAVPLALVTAGCGDDEARPPVGTGTGGGGSGSFTLGGVLSYERVPRDSVNEGLDYTKTAPMPIRGALVRLLRAEDDAEIERGASGDDGSYSFAYQGAADVKLWIYASTVEPAIAVQDNTADGAIYVIESDVVDASSTSQLDVLATTGWDGGAYSGPRAAAPFAIVDSAYGAALRFRSEVSPPPSFPPLRLNWSADNRPEGGDPSSGFIGTSHWDGEELYILGKEGIDTDEFDAHVIVHEWGHYFESRLSRSDSQGGVHGFGDVLDPRVAFSEGWGNALSAMILDPDTVYADSMGEKQAGGFSWDLEVNLTSAGARPGWYSEGTVEAILFDLYDGANEPHDQVSIGLAAIHAVMTGAQAKTGAMTTLFSFIAEMKAARPADAAKIDALVAHHTFSASLGVDAIADVWGAGETHTGGVAGSLPVYADGVIGGAMTVTLVGGAEYNTLAANRFIKIIGDGAPVKVRSTSPVDVDLFVYRAGALLDFAESVSGNEQVSFNTANGQVYIVNVQGYNDVAQSYSVGIDIFH